MKTFLAVLVMALCTSVGAQDGVPPLKPNPVAEPAYRQGAGPGMSSLGPHQVDNLVLLGQIWGFLKYHHPTVTAGQRNWDHELLLQLPVLLAASDRHAAVVALVRWIDALGPLTPCAPCATVAGSEVHFQPSLSWLDDVVRLTPELSQRLQAIYRNRPVASAQFYVSQASPVGNPMFDREAAYKDVPLSDASYRLLAVYRFWSIVEYWFPYRSLMGGDWQNALKDAIVNAVMAPNDVAYQQGLMALIAQVHDTHANLWSSLAVRPPIGDCKVAADLRFLDGRLIVAHGTASRKTGALQAGDELVAIDGTPVATLVQEWRPYYAASNEAAALRDMARMATHAECKEASLVVRRGSATMLTSVDRVPAREFPAERTHDRSGDAFQVLPGNVAYLKLSTAKKADLAKYMAAAAGTRGLVVDLRNYPAEFMTLQLAGLLVDRRTPFARFTRADLANPGLFRWSTPVAITPVQPHYAGKIVVLVDEITQSQAEYTAMALRSVPGALVVGSTTAGADGNVSFIPLPGGLRAAISGIGVFYPDRGPTQRLGIVPDLAVTPTAEGLRAGRDEVLETAIRAFGSL